MGVIYIVDRVFASNQQIDEAIRRNPASETPWGPIDPSHQGNVNNQDVESQTVVVDLVAEFLREQAEAAAAGQQQP